MSTCKLADSCQLIINSKDKEIEEKNERIEELEDEIEKYDTKDKVLKGFLFVQAAILAITFQIWN